MTRRRLALALILLAAPLALLVPSSAHAQQDPNLARGFTPGKVYDFSGVESINLFNGNLTLTIPIGQRYPVGDGLEYGFTAVYNTNVWEFSQVRHPQTQELETAATPRQSNSALGWQLGFGGRLFNSSHPDSRGHWRFESEDGSEHAFYDTLHEGEPVTANLRYSRDGSYLRLDTSGNPTLTYPDGTTRQFAPDPYELHAYRLVRIEDPHQNWVKVTYQGRNWTVSDSVGRSHQVFFGIVSGGGATPRVTSVSLAKFGGGRAAWSFQYVQRNIAASCKDNETLAGRQEKRFLVPTLTAIVGPGVGEPPQEHVRWSMEAYNTECSLGTVLDLPGTLARLRLPTRGIYEWDYRSYGFPNRGNDPHSVGYEESAGVWLKRELNAAGGCDSGPTNPSCTWTYTPRQLLAGGEKSRATVVRTPLGDETVHYFSQFWGLNASAYTGWDYGLPFRRGTQYQHGDLFLSRRVYDGSELSGTLMRSEYVLYEHDKLLTYHSGIPAQDWYDSNRRMVASRTHYDDDLSGGIPRYVEARMSAFDGIGHYRQQVTTSDFGGAASKTVVTSYNPARGTYRIDPSTNQPAPGHSYSPWPSGSPWVLGTYTSIWADEPGAAPVETRYCFNAAKGFLDRERRLVASGLDGRDVIVDYQRTAFSARDIRYNDRIYGGDTQAVTTAGSWCTVAPTAELPMYRIRRRTTDGVLSKLERLGRGGALRFENSLTIDQHTGLATSSTDATGIVTSYLYDELGRLTAIRPQAGGGAWSEIDYDPAAGTATKARASVYQRPNGFSSGATLSEARYTYDSFGRVAVDETRVPGHPNWQAVRTAYNALGWKTSVTGRGSNFATVYRLHDPFGRPREIRLPDWTGSNGHYVGLDYNGERRIGRSVSVASSLTGAETRSLTSEIYDLQGRLWRVQEPSGTNGAQVNTDYQYDSAGRLTAVRLKGPGHTQTRTFSYDGRGFLLSEFHPEKGATYYSDYDPLGHPGRVRTGVGEGLFDLAFTYDDTERLTRVAEFRYNGSGRELKSFVYGTGTSAANRSMNKILTATRHNYVPHPTSGNPLDFVVAETYTYGGTGGRPSQRDTAINPSTAGPLFRQGWTYDDLGQVKTTTYPTCLHVATCNAQGSPHPRTVSRTYDQGFLTAVPGFASAISYHPNGMLAEVAHTNANTYGQGADPHGMRRPGSLYLEQNGQLVPLAPGLPSLLGQAVPHPYEYDGAGNVEGWSVERYRYDPVSRILETDNDGTENQSYTYDPYGNLTSILGDGGGSTFAIDVNTNRLSATPYDAAGNQTQSGTPGSAQTYQYDAFSMMWHRGGSGAHDTYAYTADDERIWSIDATVSPWKETVFLRDLDGTLLRTFGTETGGLNLAWRQDYIHRDGQPLATVKAENGETVYHFHPNHLGTPILTTDPMGGYADLMFLYPYGQAKDPSAVAGNTERLRFTGHERDLNGPNESDDLDYMHARFCSPMTGRFLSVDSASGQPRRPQSWNRYSYAYGNPLRLVDPDGRTPRDFVLGKYKFHFDTAHGGPHFDVSRRVGGSWVKLGRVRVPSLEPIRHKGKTPHIPRAAIRKLKRFLRKGGGGPIISALAIGLTPGTMNADEPDVDQTAQDLFGQSYSSLTPKQQEQVAKEHIDRMYRWVRDYDSERQGKKEAEEEDDPDQSPDELDRECSPSNIACPPGG